MLETKDDDPKPKVTKKELAEYKKQHWVKHECDECGTTKGVRYDDPSCNNYCWPCLEKFLIENPVELFESIYESPDYSY